MSDRQRGAAQVSLMWVIALGVITLFVVFFAFLGQNKISRLEEEKAAAQAKAAEEEANSDQQRQALSNLSAVVGFKENTAGSITEPASIKPALDQLASTFPSVPDTVGNLGAAVPLAIADYNGQLSQNRDLTQQVATLRNDLSARQTELRTVMTQKDGTIASLQSDLEDTRTSLNTQVADLERQRDALRDQVRDLERTHSETVARNDTEKRDLKGEIRTLGDRNMILSERLNTVQRAEASPDGTVLNSSANLGKAYIDRGRLKRVHVGMEFDVLDRRTEQVKGRLKVIRVDDDLSEARILSEVDRYNPISEGDLIRNAIYDPNRTPIAVLLGNGFGRYTETDMRNLLREVGLEVRDSVTREVDYLILGTAFFDPETGDRIPFESRDEYKAAEAYAVQILPLRDVIGWLGI